MNFINPENEKKFNKQQQVLLMLKNICAKLGNKSIKSQELYEFVIEEGIIAKNQTINDIAKNCLHNESKEINTKYCEIGYNIVKIIKKLEIKKIEI